MPSVKHIIELSDADRKVLTDLVGKGTSSAKAILRANILLASDRNNAKYMTVAEIQRRTTLRQPRFKMSEPLMPPTVWKLR